MFARLVGIALALIALALPGCGSQTSATLYVLFDSSQSSSQLIREGYRNDAILIAVGLCRDYHTRAEVVFDAISPSAEAESRLTSLPCPEFTNETDYETALVSFEAQAAAVIDEMIALQADSAGTDIIGAVVHGAVQTFERFDADRKFLVLFSDMQQSGHGIAGCVRKRGTRAGGCVDVYYRRTDNQEQRRQVLDDVAVFAVGVGRTVKGRASDADFRSYSAFWRAFFDHQGARVCWFEPSNLPVVVRPDGSRAVNGRYFRADCSASR